MILVSNDDGIYAHGLWTLAAELSKIDQTVIVAPDREQSATGTAITLRQPLRVQKANSLHADIEAYSIEGTPGDSVILATSKLFQGRISVVVSGINSGLNLGDDILISGTVSAALQGYLRNLPAIAISVGHTDSRNLENAARLVRIIASSINSGILPGDIFLNINYPDRPLEQIQGLIITQPAHKTHIDTVKEGNDGRRDYYWLVRDKLGNDAPHGSDIWALENGYISITPLHNTMFHRPHPELDQSFCSGLLCQLRSQT
jgi:5'-nucleotidase